MDRVALFGDRSRIPYSNWARIHQRSRQFQRLRREDRPERLVWKFLRGSEHGTRPGSYWGGLSEGGIFLSISASIRSIWAPSLSVLVKLTSRYGKTKSEVLKWVGIRDMSSSLMWGTACSTDWDEWGKGSCESQDILPKVRRGFRTQRSEERAVNQGERGNGCGSRRGFLWIVIAHDVSVSVSRNDTQKRAESIRSYYQWVQSV